MIAIIEGCGNNYTSIVNALRKLSCDFILTKDAKIIRKAKKVILPGVGTADQAMKNLSDFGLIETIINLSQPVLGICLGMQLLYDFTEEKNTTCLGIIPGVVKKFQGDEKNPVPHMGWNRLAFSQNKLFENFGDQNYFYFAHSYYTAINEYTIAKTNYSCEFTSVVKKDNFIGMQFHPERSSNCGFRILKNFMSI